MKNQISKLEQFAANLSTKNNLTDDQKKMVKGGGYSTLPLGTFTNP